MTIIETIRQMELRPQYEKKDVQVPESDGRRTQPQLIRVKKGYYVGIIRQCVLFCLLLAAIVLSLWVCWESGFLSV